MANWLNIVFYAIDKGAFTAVNSLAVSAGAFFGPICEVMAILGDAGIAFILTSIILMCFNKTRKTGLVMLMAIAVGALFTNIIIKNVVARPRPYTVEEYKLFWNYVGAHGESEYSFPSGHVTVTMTAMTALFIMQNKKWSWIGFVLAVIMGFSRVYLVVHYLTDVIAGFIVGGISGVIAYYVYKWIEKVILKRKKCSS